MVGRAVGTEEVVALIGEYEAACNSRDTEKYREILALQDPRFREIEDHIAEPFGAAVAEDILRWIAAHPDFEYRVHYRNIQAFALGDDAAYAVAQHEWQSPNGRGRGRTTFIAAKCAEGWKIVHGHWSAEPPQEAGE
jgi:ketosteroid isomerase-like protein